MGINSLSQALHFFFIITIELVVLFIGVSFLVGLLQEYIPAATVQRLLTGRRGQGNVLGAVLGAITPFCSCSTIPIMVGLINAGAPFGAASSFLLASPLLNPVILGLLLAFLGWQATVTYAAVTFILSVVLGAVWEKIGLASQVKRVRISGGHVGNRENQDFRSRLVRALGGAWNQFIGVLPYLFIGVAIGAFIYGFVPAEFVARVAGPGNPLAIPVAAVIGIPLYIRVETMIPIGMVLLQKGMSLGTLMALIIGGAGASIPEVSLLAGIFKPRLVVAFVLTIFTVAVLAGYAFNIIFV
ncbi:Putative two-component membrane permease complex subunit [Neomoorella glycerini]|uniref:Two-component membrane permease complex subunit n=1 Tax=Neomoorella glycerini TaxID=55779 RepID=A0A6I5ZPE5_9FIRM|nr:permease [Moorella glycerini]QGP91439.1 Putative two-component membrane permease complex subunit [Moorella glycerini]